MKCEKCNCEHDGTYGSGRFCSRSCAASRTFSKESRLKKSMANKKHYKEHGWSGKNNIIKFRRTWKKKIMESDFDSLSYLSKRKRVIWEQDCKCKECGLNKWREKPLTLELEHLNGNHSDNNRSNLAALCPNCHSITRTWRGRNKKDSQHGPSDMEIWETYQDSKNIRQTLIKLGIAAKGNNYARVKRVVRKYIDSNI